SRRRHTRSKRDWSSDVCSSDLVLFLLAEDRFSGRQFTRFRGSALSGLQVLREGFGPVDFSVQLRLEACRFRLRLELAPLSRFVRRLGSRLEGLDLFGQCR